MTPPSPAAVAIGRAIRGAIAQAGMTQEEVAQRTDMSLTTLSRRINGGLAFSWPEIVAIAQLVDVTPSELAQAAERIAERTAVPA